MDLYTYRCIGTMDINQCGFYANTFAILCQIVLYYNITENYSITPYEIY